MLGRAVGMVVCLASTTLATSSFARTAAPICALDPQVTTVVPGCVGEGSSTTSTSLAPTTSTSAALVTRITTEIAVTTPSSVPESGAPLAPPAPICSADAKIFPNDTGLSVACLQGRLFALGLYAGVVNGKSDTATVDAVKRFQKVTPPLEVDGIAGPRTLAALGIWSGITRQTQFAPGTAPAGPWPAPLLGVANSALTLEGIPFFAGRVACGRADADMIAFQFALDGADVATQQWAVYIASREGGCQYQTININPATADDSHCTFQLNALSGTFLSTGELGRRGWTTDLVKASMELCANAASDLWVYCGRGPWEPPYSCAPPWKSAAPQSVPATTTTSSAPTAPPVTVPYLALVPATTLAAPGGQNRSAAATAVAQSCSTR